MNPVRFLDEAREELLLQVAYYEEKQKGLGERFRLAVVAATSLAAMHPKLGSPWKLRTRRVFPKGFPFSGQARHLVRADAGHQPPHALGGADRKLIQYSPAALPALVPSVSMMRPNRASSWSM